MNLYIDSESTGLIPKDLNWQYHFDRLPRVVSIAWRLEGNPPQYYILNQGTLTIPPMATDVHGITDEMCWRSPHFPKDVFPLLIEDALKADRIVGWNLYFDTSLIKANVLKQWGTESKQAAYIIQGFDKSKRIDLMRKGASINSGWMTMEKAHRKHFPDIEYNPHNAANDIEAVERLYGKYVELGIIKP